MQAQLTGTTIQFSELSPAPDVAFWQRLTQRKLDILRLDESPIPVCGYYEAFGAKCALLADSFSDDPSFPPGSAFVRGELKNFNTVEEFRNFFKGSGRTDRVASSVAALREAIVSGAALQDPALLRPMLIVTFADLKKYHFAYTVGFPVLAPPQPWSHAKAAQSAEDAGIDRESLCRISRALVDDISLAGGGVFLLVRASPGATWVVRSFADLAETARGTYDDAVIGFVDSSADEAPGWPMRNLILTVAHFWPGEKRFLAFRDPHLHAKGSDTPTRSQVFAVHGTPEAAAAALTSPTPASAQLAGWHKIQTFDLTMFLDKRRIAADAVDLNVKLMKWRLLPELVPERMQNLRFLMLGAGTLGCSVARTLMGWGVRRMTFVDSGRVSLSNPVRQSLFTHQDAADGRPKAQAAREAVLGVMPDAEAEAVELEIPMPGHPHQDANALQKAVQQLKGLIARHDVVCMLTDSRESRWLPSLLVAAAQQGGGGEGQQQPPLGLTVALGFDSFLVSRQTYLDSPAACYFCNDMSAPADSIAFRTLDQQCTVTRPGLAGLASSIAVELIAALSQHPDGFRARFAVERGGPVAPGSRASAAPGTAASPLGTVPHQIRGYLADFRLAPMETEPFSKCICCSEAVLGAYLAEGMGFVERIISDSAELERISGLQAMKAAVKEGDVVNFDEFDDDA